MQFNTTFHFCSKATCMLWPQFHSAQLGACLLDTGNHFEDEGLLALIPSLRQLKALFVLSMYGNDITQNMETQLGFLVLAMPALKSIKYTFDPVACYLS
jgi:hypothetical protein